MATVKNNIFTPEIRKKADKILAQYETKRASILEILRLLQEEHGFISLEAEDAVAQYLEITPIDVHEVVSFYTLFYREPKAQLRLHVCRTLTCSILGGGEILKYIEQRLGVRVGEKDPNNKCSVQAVECLGACELAPMLQVNDDRYLGHLTKKKVDELIQKTVK